MLIDDGEGDDVILGEELRDLFLVNMRLHVDELGLKISAIGERARRPFAAHDPDDFPRSS